MNIGYGNDASVVGEVKRVWDYSDTEIWALLHINNYAFSRQDLSSALLVYPELDASHNSALDDQPASWFTYLEIIGITLGDGPIWPELRPVTLG